MAWLSKAWLPGYPVTRLPGHTRPTGDRVTGKPGNRATAIASETDPNQARLPRVLLKERPVTAAASRAVAGLLSSRKRTSGNRKARHSRMVMGKQTCFGMHPAIDGVTGEAGEIPAHRRWADLERAVVVSQLRASREGRSHQSGRHTRVTLAILADFYKPGREDRLLLASGDERLRARCIQTLARSESEPVRDPSIGVWN